MAGGRKMLEAENAVKPAIVLVHGVWLDASSWLEVIKELGHKGYAVHAAQLPLTSFEDDVAALNRVIQHAGRPVILVGHSYGGAVISAAGNHDSVLKLVYITALVPEPDQPFGAILGQNPPASQVEMKPDAEGFIWADVEGFQDAIAHDIHRGRVTSFVAVQKPFAGKVFEASIPDPAWQSRPSWYLVTTDDRILNPKTQHALAARINATVHEVATSHLPQVARAQAVIDIILDAAEA
jgi:pimeloyl-ACP methyl ester carboxylesterase